MRCSAHEGTSLERFIMLRRLQHCRRPLEDPAQCSRTVSDIAYSYGFSDMSHFTRRFKAQFGCSPSECRQQALKASIALHQTHEGLDLGAVMILVGAHDQAVLHPHHEAETPAQDLAARPGADT